MHKKAVRLRILSLIIALLLITALPNPANAYVLNGWVISDPTDIQYKIGGNVGQYASRIISNTELWDTYCSEITLTCATDKNIYFYNDNAVSNGTYAICYHHSDDRSTITFYQAFSTTSASIQNEVIIHEVGHSLGLAHCEAAKNDVSVMHQYVTGLISRPMADDIAGISAIYN